MRRVASLLVLMTLVTACDTSNFAFKIDESIEIVEPKARTTVALPITIRWTDNNKPLVAKVAPRDPIAEYYAVFVDRAPMGPGKTLASLIKGPPPCRPSTGCPTSAQLSDLSVFLTAEPSLSLEFLTDLRSTSRGNQKDPHEVTIVRMRGDKRVGEAAFLQNFFVRR